MAKRRAEDCLLFESPTKLCCGLLSRVDTPLNSMAATGGGVSPPALLTPVGSSCKKRPRLFEDPDSQAETKSTLRGKATHCNDGKHANIETVHVSGSFQERRISSGLDSNPPKRPRTDSKSSATKIHGPAEKDNKEKNTEDCTYNSFQYWRVPLPELDLSLLEEGSHDHQTKESTKLKDSSSDAMET